MTSRKSKWSDFQSMAAILDTLSPPYIADVEANSSVTAKQIYKSFEIIWDAPRQSTSYEIATYFSNVNTTNEAGELYTQEWNNKLNPLIISFFVLADYEPDGDITPWCAAFMNFCLATGGEPTTSSPGSSSFRKYGTSTNLPEEGDLVVFKSTVAGEEWRGHVGFYISQDESSILTLGGNQKDGIRKSRFKKNGDYLEFHSFRKRRVPNT